MRKNFKGNIVLTMLMLSMCFGAAPAWGSTYYLHSQWGGTWHDVNKSRVDDTLMCWAASASNILDWDNWDTATYSTECKIFKKFKDHWTNNRGWQSWAWQWWLNGTPPPYNTYAYVNVAGGGKYWPTYNFYSYYTTASGSGEMAAMDSLMHKGYGISLVIGPNHTNQHAITAWGYDYTTSSTGAKNYTALYITDSDDGVIALKRMSLAYSTTNGWYFTSGYTNWNIMGVYAFGRRSGTAIAPYSSLGAGGLPGAAAPIMPTWTFMATGLLLLLILQTRRRYS